MVVLAATAVGAAMAYQTAARQRDYRALLARGDAALLDEQTLGAIEAYSGAIALRPDSMLAHLRLGETYQRRGDVEEAAREFRRAAGLDPSAIRPVEELGDAEYQRQRYGPAIEAYQRSVQLDDRAARVSYKLALARYRDGQLDLAVVMLGNALERAPDQPLIYSALGQVWLDLAPTRSDALPKALEALERVASGPSATSDILTLYGRALLQDGNAEAAERALEQATVRHPVDPSSFLFYANAAEQQNHLDASRRALMSYGALVPNDPELASRATRIATLSLRLNDAPAAADWFERAATASPNDLGLLASLADAQLRAGSRDAAQVTITRGLEKDPKNAPLLTLARRIRIWK